MTLISQLYELPSTQELLPSYMFSTSYPNDNLRSFHKALVSAVLGRVWFRTNKLALACSIHILSQKSYMSAVYITCGKAWFRHSKIVLACPKCTRRQQFVPSGCKLPFPEEIRTVYLHQRKLCTARFQSRCKILPADKPKGWGSLRMASSTILQVHLVVWGMPRTLVMGCSKQAEILVVEGSHLERHRSPSLVVGSIEDPGVGCLGQRD